MGHWIKLGLKWGTLAMLAYVLLVHVRPVYWDAWKAKKAADRIAATSAGKLNTEVRDAYLEAVKAAGLKTITASEISVSRNGQGWDVEVEYQVSRKLADKVDLIFDFSISSDRAGLWASNNQS